MKKKDLKDLNVILTIAQWAVSQTRAIIPYSENYPQISNNHHQQIIFSLIRHEPNHLNDAILYEEIASWHLDVSSQKKHPLAYSEYYVNCLGGYVPFKILFSRLNNMADTFFRYKYSLRYIEISAQRALRFGLGNCTELSNYALLLLLEAPYKGSPIRIELFGFPNNNDHIFLVLNRTKGNFNDLSSWNDDAVFCDPWQTENYTKKYLIAHRDDEALQYIYNAFKTELQKIWFLPNQQDAFVGMNADLKFYSKEWHKPRKRQYWEPTRLMMVKNRSAFTIKEQLPATRPLSLKIKKFGFSLDHLIFNHQSLSPKQEKLLRWDILFSRNYLVQKINGDTPIVRAAKVGRWDIVQIFADYPTDNEDKAEYGNALIYAFLANQREIVFQLIEAKAKTDWYSNYQNGENNPLHYAIFYNDIPLLQVLLKTNIQAACLQKNRYHETPLELAKRIAPDLLPIFEANGFPEKKVIMGPIHENNEDTIHISEIENEEVAPSLSDSSPEIDQNKEILNPIENFKKIYRALYKTQSSLFSRNFIKKLDKAAEKEQCILTQIKKYPNSKSAIAWKLANEYSENLSNLDLIRAIHTVSYKNSFFKHSKNKKILREATSLDNFLDRMHKKSSSETIIRCLEIN